MVSIMDEIISYKMCAVKVRNAKLRNYLNNLLEKSILNSEIALLCTHVPGDAARVISNILVQCYHMRKLECAGEILRYLPGSN